ncbi:MULTISPECIES: hypothetical protein [Methylobacterium]|uniref:hypothetical protein n=1 Tax=Methylobacterium TaxID=407 RepID=UPI0012E85996|nr:MULTISPECIES: hypothetical protein [Methylobacterium]MCI9882317.1 hypothetical protein [Methylobacterium goesingense]
MPTDPFAEAGSDPSRGPIVAAKPESGGLATGPRDTVTGQVEDAPGEPMDRPGTEAAEDGAIDGPRLTPQGRTGDAAQDADETDPMGGVKTGQTDKAEG